MNKLIKVLFICLFAGFISVNLLMNFYIMFALIFLDYEAVFIYEYNSILMMSEFILLCVVIPIFFYWIKKTIDRVIED